jgi:TonB family protein
MRKLILLLLVSCSCFVSAQAQNNKAAEGGAEQRMKQEPSTTPGAETPSDLPKAKGNDEPVYKFVEQMPSFDGDLNAFLAANMKYPEEARKAGTEGKVYILFIIEKDGSISGITVKRPSGSKALDAEAVRVIGLMPNWIPGKQQGKAVNVFFTMPITFKLG